MLFFFSVIVKTYAQDSTFSVSDYTLDEITVESDKLNMKLTDVPTKVEVISRKEVASTNGDRLPSILKTKSNIFIKSYGLSPALSTISTNGLSAEHTLIVVDGVKLNSFQNSHIDLSLIPKDYIEKIEVINNGVSSIYGSEALGGVINIILKNKEILPEDRTTKYGFSMTHGSFNTLGYSLSGYKEIGEFNIGVNFNKETSDGNFKYYFNDGNNKILKERQNAGYTLYDVALRTQYLLDNDNIIKFISTYSDQDKEVPGIETGTAPAPTRQLDKIWNNILTFDKYLGNDFQFRTNLNFQNNFTDYSVGRFLKNTYKNLVYAGSTEIRFKKADYGITSGYNFAHAKLESEEVLEGIKRNQHAIFISSFFNIHELLKIYPSIRYDYISDISEQTLTYKFGINYKPVFGQNFGVRGNVGKNFRAPSFNDLYWKNSGNENLEPEKSFNIEGGFYYSFYNFLNGRFELTYTYITADNKIVWIPQSNGFWTPKNIAESVSNNYSFSVKLSKPFSERFTIYLNSGLQLTNSIKTSSSYKNDPTLNKHIPYIPLQGANINLGINYLFFEINLFYSYSGSRFSDYENTKEMKHYNSIDGNIAASFSLYDFKAKLRLEINNITNTDYEVISGYPMPLRYYKLTLSINY